MRRQRQEQYGGAETEEEEKTLAVREFLDLELKMTKAEIDVMEIERIFAPAKENPKYLYVTFRYESSVKKILEKTRFLRKESRVFMYVPKQFYERFVKLRSFEYSLRTKEKCQTRVKMGTRDLQLFKRFRGESWREIALPEDLPLVELGSSGISSECWSPAPGRPAGGWGGSNLAISEKTVNTEEAVNSAQNEVIESTDIN